MDRYKLLSVLLAGVIIGMACSDGLKKGGIDAAHAAEASACEQWEVDVTFVDGPIPAGWEPFAQGTQQRDTIIRRCAD